MHGLDNVYQYLMCFFSLDDILLYIEITSEDCQRSQNPIYYQCIPNSVWLTKCQTKTHSDRQEFCFGWIFSRKIQFFLSVRQTLKQFGTDWIIQIHINININIMWPCAIGFVWFHIIGWKNKLIIVFNCMRIFFVDRIS